MCARRSMRWNTKIEENAFNDDVLFDQNKTIFCCDQIPFRLNHFYSLWAVHITLCQFKLRWDHENYKEFWFNFKRAEINNIGWTNILSLPGRKEFWTRWAIKRIALNYKYLWHGSRLMGASCIELLGFFFVSIK